MRKIIKRKIHISTHKRDLIDFINDEFYSHDKHNAFIEFTMKSLPTDNIIALFYFQKTKRYVETKAFVDGDKFTIEFDTSLITADETVLGFIYFEKVAQSADVHRFSFGVRVSEIDKLHDIPIQEQSTKRVVAIEDIVTKAELDELFKRIEKNGGTYNDTEIRSSITSIEERVQTLESKQDKDTVYDDSDVKNRLSTLETNASRYLTEHQSLSEYALKSEIPQAYNDTALVERVSRLEQKPAVDTSGLATKEELQEVRNAQPQIDKTDLVTKEELEAKGYLTAHQNLDEYAKKSEIPERYNDASLVERVTSLESKAIANGSYDDKPLLEKIHAIEEQFRNASNLYLTAHQSLDHLVTKQELEGKGYLTSHQSLTDYATKSELNTLKQDVVTHNELANRNYLTEHQSLDAYAKKSELPAPYNDSALISRIVSLESRPIVNPTMLVTKDELAQKGYLTSHQSLTDYATKSELNTLKQDVVTHNELANRNYLTEHQSLDAYAKKSELPAPYNDSALISRIVSLESRPIVNPTMLVTKDELAQKGYLTAHQSLANYALKSELYNDSEIKRRLSTLESKPSGTDPELVKRVVALENRYIASFDDSEIRRRLADLEGEATVHSDDIVTKTFLNSKGYLTEASLANINRTLGEYNTKINTLQSKAEFEIHGTGMPNGRVTAPIGTTYVDTAVTNGALKWIKQSGSGNTGWKVLIGDTGWRKLEVVSIKSGAFVKIRRVNNLVTYNFGGLSWGWFGITRRGASGFVGHGSSGNRGAKIVTPGKIPEGFRSESSLIGSIFDDGGRDYGVWYLGGKSDSNYIQMTFSNDIPTDREIGDIRVSAISYITDEDWPVTLP